MPLDTLDHRADRHARRARRVRLGRGHRHPRRPRSPSPAPRWTSRRGPTRTRGASRLEPDEVAIPGLTDAHLHLAQAARALRQVDLSARRDARRRAWPPSAAAARAARRRPGRLDRRPRLGSGPLGPLADRRRPRAGRARAPGRPVGARPPRAARQPRGAADRRRHGGDRRTRPAASSGATADGAPKGVLHEAAARLVTVHIPAPDQADLEAGARRRSAGELRRARGRRLPRPGRARAGPGADLSLPGLRRISPSAATCRSASTRSLRDDALATAIAGGLRSGDVLGDGPRRPGADRLAEALRRRLAGLADGGAARRHRAGGRTADCRPSGGAASG